MPSVAQISRLPEWISSRCIGGMLARQRVLHRAGRVWVYDIRHEYVVYGTRPGIGIGDLALLFLVPANAATVTSRRSGRTFDAVIEAQTGLHHQHGLREIHPCRRVKRREHLVAKLCGFALSSHRCRWRWPGRASSGTDSHATENALSTTLGCSQVVFLKYLISRLQFMSLLDFGHHCWLSQSFCPMISRDDR